MNESTKVLIVSGDARVREPAAEVLLRGGFVVDQADGTEVAVESARAHRPPDVVLVDCTTLDCDPRALLDHMAKAVEGPAPKAVLLVGQRTPEEWRRHPAVVYVLEIPAGVRSLVALADWIGERDPHDRPSVILRPLARVSSRDDRGDPRQHAS